MAYLHGISVTEQEQQTVVEGSYTIAIVGTAAIGDKDVPVRVRSLAQMRDTFGYPTPGATLSKAVDILLRYKGGNIVCVNVATPAVTREAAFNVTLSGNTATLPHAHIDNVVVTDITAATTYVDGTDYRVDLVKGEIERVSSGAIASGDTIKVAYDRPDFSGVAEADVVGGTSPATGTRTGIDVLLNSNAVLGLKPDVIVTPGFRSVAVVEKLGRVSKSLRCQYIVDSESAKTVQEAIDARSGDPTTEPMAIKDERAILTYPATLMSVSQTGGVIVEPFSVNLAGVMALKKYWLSPSNKPLIGIRGYEVPILFDLSDPTADSSRLNNAGYVTYFPIGGKDPRAWGNFNGSREPDEENISQIIQVIEIKDRLSRQIEAAAVSYVDRNLTAGNINAIEELIGDILANQPKEAIVKFVAPKFSSEDSDIPKRILAFALTAEPAVPIEQISILNTFVTTISLQV